MGFLLVYFPSAYAVEYESGYRSCAGVGGGIVVTYGRTKGYPRHVQNTVYKDLDWSVGWQTTSFRKSYTTANWQVSGSTDLEGGYTRAGCPE